MSEVRQWNHVEGNSIIPEFLYLDLHELLSRKWKMETKSTAIKHLIACRLLITIGSIYIRDELTSYKPSKGSFHYPKHGNPF